MALADDLPCALVLGVFSEILLRSAICSTPRCVCSDGEQWLFYLAQILIATACTGVSEFWFLGVDSSFFAYVDGGFFYVLGTLSTKGISRFT